MNERLKVLSNMALDYAEQNQVEGIPRHWFILYNQHYAESIINECVSVIDDAERGSNAVWDNAVKFIKKDLKEHFGVE